MTKPQTLPPLVADGGELRLSRRVASYVYGRREVTWPEDVDDPEESLPDGREFGWVAKIDDYQPGLSERRFVRGDVKINVVEEYSNVEEVLDDSALRSGGEVFFETMLEGRGLGLLVPGIDFSEGDLVDVRFWGRILEDQLVTAIDWSDGVPAVALGGQTIRDSDALARTRAEMIRLIKGERADRVDEVGKVNRKASAAQGAADSAIDGVDGIRSVLAGEGSTSEDVQEALDALNQQLQEEGETEQSLPLIQAYISANTARWALQQQVDKMQDQVTRELADQQLALKRAFEEDRKNRTERVVATAAGSSNPDHPVTNLSNGNWRISLNDVKNATLIADIWELAGEDRINHLLKQYAPTASVFQLTLNSNQVFSAEWIRTPGFVRSVNEEWSGSYSLGSASTWYNITGFGAPEIRVGASGTSNFDMSVSVRWPDAWGYYRLQILAGSQVLADEQREGSSTIFKQVPMTQTLTVSNVKIPANTDVRVRASRSSQIASGNYRYTAVTTRASWTERNV